MQVDLGCVKLDGTFSSALVSSLLCSLLSLGAVAIVVSLWPWAVLPVSSSFRAQLPLHQLVPSWFALASSAAIRGCTAPHAVGVVLWTDPREVPLPQIGSALDCVSP